MLQYLGRCGECGGPLGGRTCMGQRYIYCFRQWNYPHLSNCYKPKYLNLNRIKDYIWAEVEDVLDSFVFYKDGRIELRFKLPIDGEQVANTIATLSNGVKSTYE